MKKTNLILFLLFIPTLLFAQKKKRIESVWVDSVYQAMTVEERIGQLFMVAAYSNKDNKHIQSLENLVREQKIGGVIFFQGGPGRQAYITNRLQKISQIPLFVGIDAEWGLSMRLDSTHRYPWNMTLGAIKDTELIEEIGVQMGEQCKRLGVHFTFAPVVDINTNPSNPIIGTRSYGETKEIVARHSVAYMKGLQSKKVWATAKHFPGHGDTSTDSHHTLPFVDFTKKRIEEIELYPYKALFDKGLASVMVAHLEVPSLESRKGVPTSLSSSTITQLLRHDLKFNGLIFTDALNMKGVSNYKSPGDVDLEAFMAGNDVLLFPENVPLAIQKIKEAYDNNIISEERLAVSVKKILKYKYESGLHHHTAIASGKLYEDLNDKDYKALNKKLYEAAMTLVKEEDILPLRKSEKIAYVKLGDDVNNDFVDFLQRETRVTTFFSTALDSIGILNEFDKVVVGFHKPDGAWKNHDFSGNELRLLEQIAATRPTILVAFTKPYALSSVRNFKDLSGVLVAYQNNIFAHRAAVDVLFGHKSAKGRLPVSINSEYPVKSSASVEEEEEVLKEFYLSSNTSYQPGHLEKNPSPLYLTTEEIQSLWIQKDSIKAVSDRIIQTDIPENVGLDSKVLARIDDIAQSAIFNEYTPGIQVLVARHGKVVFEKSYGKQTYNEESLNVNSETVYDLASLTKILATLPMVMKMYEDKSVRLDQTLGELLVEFKNTDKAGITLKQILLHESGFAAWIPFYKSTLKNGYPDPILYKDNYSEEYPIQICENLFLKKDYHKEIVNQIKASKLGAKTYKYSDLNFILLKEIVERHYGKPLDELLHQHFYRSIGTYLTFNPLKRFPILNIAPTEIDNYYRHTLIKGYVHDMGAAMFGGVAGHAGLFGTSRDVYQMMQFFLNGLQGKETILSKQTLETFNTCYSCSKGSRRGAGFDKQQIKGGGPTCGCASSMSFGHTGFTGTIAWADPEYDLVYVFLSNRTFPYADENRLSKANIREKIQQLIYDAILH